MIFPVCLVLLLGLVNVTPAATNPHPANGATLESTWVTLSWTPEPDEMSYDVYLGDSFAAVDNGDPHTFRGNQAASLLIVGFPGFAYPGGLIPGTKYYWRVDVVDASGGITRGPVWQFNILPRTAHNPYPPDRAILVDLNVVLSWSAGLGAKSHDVYFGTDRDAVANGTGGTFKGNVGTATYNPGPLAPDTTYYWRVDEFDGINIHEGVVWRFITTRIWPVPLWRPFWFLDAKIMLHYAPYPVYVHTGFWGGWYPYHYHHNYYYPWYGPVFCHPCCWPMRWHYWWWDWPWRLDCQYSGYWYQGCWWWWRPWRGGPYFWGFLDRVSYRYRHYRPCITYWWSWYWIYRGRGRCLEIVTLGDGEGGGQVRPLDDTVLDNLHVVSHEFNVNGSKTEGVFTSPDGDEGMARVKVLDLLDHYVKLGADEEDIAALENSDIYQNLMSNSSPDDEVLVQVAEFEIPDPRIRITQPGESTIVREGQTTSYEISLPEPSEHDVAITVTPQVNVERINLGNGFGKPVTLRFAPGDTGPKIVRVSILEDAENKRSELAVVTHTVETQDRNYTDYQLPSVQIGITDKVVDADKESGGLSYSPADINRDGLADLNDLILLTSKWLEAGGQ